MILNGQLKLIRFDYGMNTLTDGDETLESTLFSNIRMIKFGQCRQSVTPSKTLLANLMQINSLVSEIGQALTGDYLLHQPIKLVQMQNKTAMFKRNQSHTFYSLTLINLQLNTQVTFQNLILQNERNVLPPALTRQKQLMQ